MYANPFLLFNWICAWMSHELLLKMDCRIGSSYGQQYNDTDTLGASSPPYTYFNTAPNLNWLADYSVQNTSHNPKTSCKELCPTSKKRQRQNEWELHGNTGHPITLIKTIISIITPSCQLRLSYRKFKSKVGACRAEWMDEERAWFLTSFGLWALQLPKAIMLLFPSTTEVHYNLKNPY